MKRYTKDFRLVHRRDLQGELTLNGAALSFFSNLEDDAMQYSSRRMQLNDCSTISCSPKMLQKGP